MEQKVLALALAVGLVIFCASRVSAQEIINVKAGSFHRWNVQNIEQELKMDKLDALAVTLPPYPDEATIFLDGEPLPSGKLLDREEVNRVWIFTSTEKSAIPVGITVFPDPPPDKLPKIRCINRRFSPIIQVNQPTYKEE